MLDRIRACIPALPPAEQRVARLLLADPRAFATLPVVELADRSRVSKPTVVRFCRSVGYDGLADFKLKLAGSVNEGVPYVHRAVDDDDKAGDIVVKVIDNAVAALLRYRNAAAEQSVERAIPVSYTHLDVYKRQTPDCPAQRGMPWRGSRCKAALAACCPCACVVASPPPSRWQPTPRSGSVQPRWAAPRA